MHGIIELMRQCGVINIYERTLHPDSKGDKRVRKEPGGTPRATPPVAVSKLEELIKDHGLIVECPRMLLELRMFKTPKAATGYHDDWVMALAIGVTNIRFATRFVERLPVINPNQGHMARAAMRAGVFAAVGG